MIYKGEKGHIRDPVVQHPRENSFSFSPEDDGNCGLVYGFSFLLVVTVNRIVLISLFPLALFVYKSARSLCVGFVSCRSAGFPDALLQFPGSILRTFMCRIISFANLHSSTPFPVSIHFVFFSDFHG